MNISIDTSTRDALLNDLTKQKKSVVRLMIKGFGWAGPSFGVVLDEQHNDDTILEVDGIKFVAENEISFLFENAKVVFRKGLFGSSFDILVPNTRNSCH